MPMSPKRLDPVRGAIRDVRERVGVSERETQAQELARKDRAQAAADARTRGGGVRNVFNDKPVKRESLSEELARKRKEQAAADARTRGRK